MHVTPQHTSPIFLTLFVACYNEEANICATLDTCLEALSRVAFPWEILVIDDASSDGSVHKINDYIRNHPGLPITLHVNAYNKGLAQNYVEGAFLGRGAWYRLICGDNVEPAETIASVISHIGEADMIIPYSVECKGRSLFRRALSRAYTVLVNLISGYRMHYYNGLAIHSRYNVMRWHAHSHGFGFQAELIVRLLYKGMSYKEVPVYTRDRVAGKSTALKLNNVLSVLHTILKLVLLRLSRWVYRRPGVAQPVARKIS